MLPKAVTSSAPAKFLKTYVATYLREEIQQEGLSRDLPGFARFLEAATLSQADLLNLSKVSSDCSVSRKTVENYFEILDALMMGFRLECFTRRAKRKLVAHPKFYFFDAGVYQAIRPRGPLDSDSEINGRAAETLVLQEIRAINSYFDLGYSIHFWRTENDVEVDFVLYGERGLIAIEVKTTDRIREKDAQPLRLFLEDYPMAKAFLLYGGSRKFRLGNIDVLPLTKFFSDAHGLLTAG
jgi:predicted AAA+ superfamily ATPase